VRSITFQCTADAVCAWLKSRVGHGPAATCVTAVEEGLEVHTTSEHIERYRKMTLELLLAERNHIC
jgi:NADH dehydrogenase/NADH:ubiquinone oxidoreductase subunit G